MSYTLSYQPEAAADVRQIAQWYEDQRRGLGREFMAELATAEERIVFNPEGYRRIHRELRRAPLDRFLFGVFYLIEKTDRVVQVVGVFHARRDPASWQQRHSEWLDS